MDKKTFAMNYISYQLLNLKQVARLYNIPLIGDIKFDVGNINDKLSDIHLSQSISHIKDSYENLSVFVESLQLPFRITLEIDDKIDVGNEEIKKIISILLNS